MRSILAGSLVSGIHRMTKSKKIGLVVLALISFGALFVLLFAPLIIPIALASMLGLLISPVVDRLEARRVPRSVSTLFCLLLVALLVAVLVGGFVPSAAQQVSLMIDRAPEAFSTFYSTMTSKLNESLRSLGFSSREVSTIAGSKAQILSNLLGRLESGLMGVWVTSTRLLSGVVDALLVPFFAFFLVTDRNDLHRLFIRLLPEDVAGVFDRVLLSTASALRSVLFGQLILIAVDSVLYVILMTALGIDGGIVLGVAAGLCRLVPYLDAIVALALGLISILMHDGGLSVMAGLGVGVLGIQAIDGMILTPRLVGGRAGLHPAVVIGTVLAFGKVFGIWGVIFAIPVAATVKALLSELVPYWINSEIHSASRARSAPVAASAASYRRMIRRLSLAGRRNSRRA